MCNAKAYLENSFSVSMNGTFRSLLKPKNILQSKLTLSKHPIVRGKGTYAKQAPYDEWLNLWSKTRVNVKNLS